MEFVIERSSLAPTHEPRRVPVLSLGAYTDGTSNDQAFFVNELFRGIKDYGFIILKDHGIEPALLTEAYGLLEKLFSLPEQVKMNYVQGKGGQRGYVPFGKEHAKDSNVMDLKEFWHVGREISPGHRYAGIYESNVWPAEIEGFKPVFLDIYRVLEGAGRSLLQALTSPLEVDQLYFDRMVEDGNSILRLLHYPPIPAGADPRCLRAAAHEDINLITILPAATASGLQLKDRNGQWLDIESDPGTLIVDAGDMLARATNDVIPSTTHRVINPQDGRNDHRYSMPFFMHPHPEAILSCIPSCRGEGAQYPDISAHDFLLERLRAIGLLS